VSEWLATDLGLLNDKNNPADGHFNCRSIIFFLCNVYTQQCMLSSEGFEAEQINRSHSLSTTKAMFVRRFFGSGGQVRLSSDEVQVLTSCNVNVTLVKSVVTGVIVTFSAF
jgi:hypothetical protein